MYDYHLHTGFSYDAYPYDVEEIVEKAIELGMKGIAITDHYDPLFSACPVELDFPVYFNKLSEVKEKYANQISVAIGIELGLMTGKALEMCSEVVNKYPLDFVIASFHSAKGLAIHSADYHFRRTIFQAVYDYYEDILACITAYDDFDILGHINVIDRYIDSIPDDSPFEDLQNQILRTLISKGKGLEINTSIFRYNSERSIPTQEILNSYVDMGGQIITIGSDAHRPSDVAERLDFAVDMVKKSGLDHITTFNERKPINIDISELEA